METINECQLPNLPKLSEGLVHIETQSFLRRVKLSLAVPWNYHVKLWIKQAYHMYVKRFGSRKPLLMQVPQSVLIMQSGEQQKSVDPMLTGKLNTGDWVRVRSWEEIEPMLDPFKETRGCAFLDGMRVYCGTEQRVLKSMQRFLDERDYKVKKVRGVILLENVICSGTPTFGQCDRCCFLFWREEWLEKITS